MSGSALAPWSVVSDPARATLKVASVLNCTEEQLHARKQATSASKNGRPRSNGGSNIDQSLLGCLRSVPLYQLMRAARPLSSAAWAGEAGSGMASNGLNGGRSMASMATAASPIRSTWGPSFDGVVVHSFKRRMRDYLDRMAR